jgi:hypothetical protein
MPAPASPVNARIRVEGIGAGGRGTVGVTAPKVRFDRSVKVMLPSEEGLFVGKGVLGSRITDTGPNAALKGYCPSPG